MSTNRAVVASTYPHGIVLWHSGMELGERLVTSYLVADLGMGEAPEGISIYEGEYEIEYDDCWEDQETGEHFCGLSKLKGEYRAPTELEWGFIKAGVTPFGAVR